LKSIFWHGPSTNSRGGKGLEHLVYVDHWGVQSSNFGFSDILSVADLEQTPSTSKITQKYPKNKEIV
jgi:hypothetical protein